MSEELAEKSSTQVTLKVPTAFLKYFDEITEQLGYPRNEAIRESMRRFVEWGYQKVNERYPERQMGAIQGIIGTLFGGIMEQAKKLDELDELPNTKDKLKQLPTSPKSQSKK